VEVAPAETAGEAEPDAIRTQAVEELFARLRAERRTESPSGHQPAVNGATVAVAASDGGGDADASSPADAAESPVPGATAPANGPPAPADPFLARRDEALGPVVIALARRVKRALQDDQNDILDRLRAKGGWVAGVLLPEDEHARRYVKASLDSLQEAARAGATLAGGKAEDSGTIDAIAEELASGIVGPLRRRLDSEGPSVEDGDDAALVELVGAAYREWKGARVERLAGDQTVAAFSQGALAAIPAGTALRWVVDDDGAECPDCDDNALAGSLPAGESFPTGHRHPPAHAGCRCLLAPLNA
jgi:AcrR family transcriptional regulator